MIETFGLAYPQPHRPFRRHRGNLFKVGFPHFFSKVSNSILGKVVIYNSMEISGSIAASALIGKTGALMASNNALNTFSISALTLGTAYYFYQYQKRREDQDLRPQVVISSLLTLPLIFYGAQESESLLERVGKTAGLILGGYAGLAFANGPAVFFDKDHPWESYSLSMLRYLSVGTIYNLTIVTPSNPYTKPIFNIPRELICVVAKTLAYNSNTFYPFFKRCFARKKIPSQILVPFLATILANTFCGQSSTKFSRELSERMITPLYQLPTLLASEDLLDRIHSILNIVTNTTVDKVASTNQYILSTIMRSLDQYKNLMRTSSIIKVAHQNYHDSFFHLPEVADIMKDRLQAALHEGIVEIADATYCGYLADSFMEEEKLAEIVDLLLTSISGIEEMFIGYSLLKNRQPIYQRTILEIYLRGFLILNIHHLTNGKNKFHDVDDKKILLDLNALLISAYLRMVTPPAFAEKVEKTLENGVNLFFDVKKIVSNILVQFEQESQLIHVKSTTENLIAEYNVTFEQEPKLLGVASITNTLQEDHYKYHLKNPLYDHESFKEKEREEVKEVEQATGETSLKNNIPNQLINLFDLVRLNQRRILG